MTTMTENEETPVRWRITLDELDLLRRALKVYRLTLGQASQHVGTVLPNWDTVPFRQEAIGAEMLMDRIDERVSTWPVRQVMRQEEEE